MYSNNSDYPKISKPQQRLPRQAPLLEPNMENKEIWSFSEESASSSIETSESETLSTPEPSFSTLPIELRLQIWSLTTPPPRIIRIGLPLGRKPKDYYAYSLSKPLDPFIPTILHINHESRTYGLSLFRLGFSSSTTNRKPSPQHKAYWTYWNPSIDILYLPSWNPPAHHDVRQDCDFPDLGFDPLYPAVPNDTFFASMLHYLLLDRVQHLALPWDFRTATSLALRPTSDDDPSLQEESGEKGHAWLPEWLKGFNSLKSVTFLIDESPQAYRAGEIVVERPEAKMLETWSEGLRVGKGATRFLALPSDIERVVLWRLEEEWGKVGKKEGEGKGKGRLVVPRVRLMIIRKERLEAEECVCVLHQPFPIRPATSTNWAGVGSGISNGDLIFL